MTGVRRGQVRVRPGVSGAAAVEERRGSEEKVIDKVSI